MNSEKNRSKITHNAKISLQKITENWLFSKYSYFCTFGKWKWQKVRNNLRLISWYLFIKMCDVFQNVLYTWVKTRYKNGMVIWVVKITIGITMNILCDTASIYLRWSNNISRFLKDKLQVLQVCAPWCLLFGVLKFGALLLLTCPDSWDWKCANISVYSTCDLVVN